MDQLRFMSKNTEEQILIELGENLQTIREAKGLSLRELAAIAGVEHSLIHRIEKGQTNTKVLTIFTLVGALEVDVCKVMKGKK